MIDINFSQDINAAPQNAVEIDRSKDINWADTIIVFCADNDIDLDSVTDADYDGWINHCTDHSALLVEHPQPNIFYFWIN